MLDLTHTPHKTQGHVHVHSHATQDSNSWESPSHPGLALQLASTASEPQRQSLTLQPYNSSVAGPPPPALTNSACSRNHALGEPVHHLLRILRIRVRTRSHSGRWRCRTFSRAESSSRRRSVPSNSTNRAAKCLRSFSQRGWLAHVPGRGLAPSPDRPGNRNVMPPPRLSGQAPVSLRPMQDWRVGNIAHTSCLHRPIRPTQCPGKAQSPR
jgi:hypothetical protein